MKLLINGLTKYLMGLFLVGVILFWPAGGFDYWEGWLFIALLFVPMLLLGVVLYLKSPSLLEKRLNVKEKRSAQKGVVGVSALLFLAGFILAGLDHRYGWTSVPTVVVIIASVILLLSYGMYAEVMRENAYLSRTVEVTEGQEVVDTGLYGVIRHPMYTSTILLFLSIPLVLGSWISFVCFLPYPAVIIVRLKNEEQLLETELKGYKEYKKRVRYRLLPFIW
ncbi:MAG: isoprenylcysteine carboxylmethyltransferase family protein [Firmicutes bacterium]|nr:isoprenylcysteine carboxylmethyltransferase family protein [Bacillota bacterium]